MKRAVNYSARSLLVLVVLSFPAGLIAAQQPAGAVLAPSQDSDDTVPRAGNSIAYPASFYTQFEPQTALDLLRRTPGFTLVAPDTDDMVRGFAANAGNVLVDGQRPTFKSGGLKAFLGRISAARVARVELIRGAMTGEAQGQTLVANLVLVEGADASGNANVQLRGAPSDGVTPGMEANYAFAAGNWQLSTGLTASYERNRYTGRYDHFDQAGRMTAVQNERLPQNETKIAANATASRAVLGGQLNANVRYAWERERYRQTLTSDMSGEPGSRIFGREGDHDGEFGIDWIRSLSRGWGLKFVGLARTATNTFFEASAGTATESGFTSRNRTTELVARTSLHREGPHWLLPELIAELAWNRLNGRFGQMEDGVALDLPGSDVRVGELRADVTANLSARLTPVLRTEAGLAYERAGLEVGGQQAERRTLSFWKPSAALIWDAGAKTQLRLGWRRTVGQLDLTGFAATGNLIDDRPIAGNARLRPEVTESASLKLDHRFGKNGGALSLTLSQETIKDALTYVPLSSGGEALLNFGTVNLWSLAGEATLPLDRWMAGARLTAKGSMTQARRPDPFGGRRADRRDFDFLEASFRHDIVRLRSAYGISAEITSSEREWYVGQYEQSRYRPYLVAYVETAMVPGYKTTLTASGITGEREHRLRMFYAPDRAGELVRVEQRTRTRGVYISMNVSRQF
ncbi:hypothetical protein NZL82_12495 [Sphingomonas sanguinis]|uniref:TonB-dependent receptor plug domain-containing protein n=1 Tax=Sphingomonas sp. LC-1 TaxID=3110957 RepID=UPI0021BB10DF|nr:TonB-dependent receptor [Sphingomonas sp. LC-1]MCT8002695.1 hypothetical protein [Sphingomonas sp. LC-1]